VNFPPPSKNGFFFLSYERLKRFLEPNECSGSLSYSFSAAPLPARLWRRSRVFPVPRFVFTCRRTVRDRQDRAARISCPFLAEPPLPLPPSRMALQAEAPSSYRALLFLAPFKLSPNQTFKELQAAAACASVSDFSPPSQLSALRGLSPDPCRRGCLSIFL